MTNREWLGKMCLADMFNVIIKNSDQCILSMFGTEMPADKCGKVNAIITSDDIPVCQICYNCVCNWLNEKNISKRS